MILKTHFKKGKRSVLLMVLISCGVFAFAERGAAQLGKSNLIQEEGAVYLEDLLDKPIKLKVVKASPVYGSLKGKRWLGNLVPGGPATLLAVSDKAYRIRARARQGQVAGWVNRKAVEGIDDELVEKLKKLYERELLVQDLIANKQIAMGMTIGEVARALGRPDNRTSKVTKEGRTDKVEYITYERVPQTVTAPDRFGRLFQSTVYVKVPVGKLTIEFEGEVVSSIEESEGSDVEGPIKIVPPPIFLY
ncbi:MAG: hypothetical protein L3J39_01060 [Verrucomicrobiales bacterium]|nr:hypothetical protein [Verrucomicrobiales bacterium]